MVIKFVIKKEVALDSSVGRCTASPP